ncbi:unnamed protein product [Prunus brigantina]
MNGFFLQSTPTPTKACKDIESALVFIGRVLESHSRLKKRSSWGPKKYLHGKWVSLIGIWDREAWWCDPHKSR